MGVGSDRGAVRESPGVGAARSDGSFLPGREADRERLVCYPRGEPRVYGHGVLDQAPPHSRGAKRKVPLVVVAIGLLAGCSAAAKTATVTSTVPLAPVVTSASTTAVPSPSVSSWTTVQAQEQYLADVATFNADLQAYRQLGVDSPLSATTTACAKLAADQDGFAKALSAGLWPTTAQTQAAALVTAVMQSRAAFQSCAVASTQTVADAGIQAAGVFGAPARAMRLALGLPSN
jgi:hypothetical protein